MQALVAQPALVHRVLVRALALCFERTVGSTPTHVEWLRVWIRAVERVPRSQQLARSLLRRLVCLLVRSWVSLLRPERRAGDAGETHRRREAMHRPLCEPGLCSSPPDVAMWLGGWGVRVDPEPL